MVNSPKSYRIYWRSILTNHVGNGQRILSYDRARQEVLFLNEIHSGRIVHWIQ